MQSRFHCETRHILTQVPEVHVHVVHIVHVMYPAAAAQPVQRNLSSAAMVHRNQGHPKGGINGKPMIGLRKQRHQAAATLFPAVGRATRNTSASRLSISTPAGPPWRAGREGFSCCFSSQKAGCLAHEDGQRSGYNWSRQLQDSSWCALAARVWRPSLAKQLQLQAKGLVAYQLQATAIRLL